MMDEADIERVASAVATKLINARLAELQAVREAALEEGRMQGTEAAVERGYNHISKSADEFKALADDMLQHAETGRPCSSAQQKLWASFLRSHIRFLQSAWVK